MSNQKSRRGEEKSQRRGEFRGERAEQGTPRQKKQLADQPGRRPEPDKHGGSGAGRQQGGSGAGRERG
jgi:hypothetical protein